MKVGLPREMLRLERAARLKSHVDRLLPGLEWVHDAETPSVRLPYLEADGCLPYKRMLRTAVALSTKVDLLWLPRLVQLDGYLMCPNFRALPDLAALNLPKAGKTPSAAIHAPLVHSAGDADLEAAARETARTIARTLGLRPPSGSDPLSEAKHPEEAAAGTEKEGAGGTVSETLPPRTLAVIGHPYVVADPVLSCGVPGLLRRYGYDIVTPEEVAFDVLNRLAADRDYYAKTLYWRPARQILGAFLYFSRIRRPAGIIQLVPFNCGVDALLRIELMSIHKQLENPPPFMVIVCDEHAQRDHVVTRVEAFLDIIDGTGIL